MDRRKFMAAVSAIASGLTTHAAHANARYLGKLILEPMSNGRLMRLREQFAFIDGQGREWAVPRYAVVDGASIPRVFWSIVGGPWEGTYRDASVIHDWFCAVRTMPWKDTHRMFYEAMLTSNVDPQQARLMFLAVRFAGPTWDDLTLQNSRLLTQDGRRRLNPPGSRVVASGFASDVEANNVKLSIRDQLLSLAAEAEQRNLTITEMEELVDQNGRAEVTATMLSPQVE